MKKYRRLLRYDWPLHACFLLTNWLPDNVVFLRLRGLLASCFLGSCGKDLRLGRNVTFYNPSQIHMGSNIYVAYGCWFMAGGTITVKDEVLFGPYCIVVSSSHSKNDGSYRYGGSKKRPIVIGKGSWLAAHVTLTAGSSIGDGDLVAAGAVVRGEFGDDVVIGGIPARVLREGEEGPGRVS